MANLQDVLLNREKYPDTQEIDIGGQKMSLGDLRNDVIPKGDMTKATQKLSEEKRALEQNVTELQSAYQGLQGQLSTLLAGRTTADGTPARTSPLSDLEADPLLGPVIAELRAVRADLSKANDTNERLQRQQVEMATTYIQDGYRRRIAELQSKDAALDPHALIQFAVSRNMPDIDMAYQLMTEDSRLKQRETEAEKRGYEKGKQEVVIPPISSGRRMTVAPPPEGVKDLDSAKDAALNDPTIERLWSGV